MTVTRVPACTIRGCPAPRDPDWHRCWCGQDKIEHHHVESRGMGGSKLKRDIVALCHHHHEAVTLHECYDIVTEFDWGKTYTYMNTKGDILHTRTLEAGSAAAEVREGKEGQDASIALAAASPASGESSAAEPPVRGAHPGPAGDSRLVPSPTAAPPSVFDLSSWCQQGMSLVYFGLSLKDSTDTWRFALGDWFNEGETILSDEAYGYLRPFKDETVRQYAWVAGTVSPDTRVLELPWSLHRAVAGRPPPEQKLLLAKAKDENLTARQFDLVIHGPPEPKVKRWTLEELRQAIHDFVERVNRRAEAEMQRTGVLEGAHHRAIQAELADLDWLETK